MPNFSRCPLCENSESRHFFSRVDKVFGDRIYGHCSICDLVFLKPSLRLSVEVERARYRAHQNSPADEGYVRFLNRLLVPLKERIPAGARGLDYGCGPGPTISVLMSRENYDVVNYDPAFFPNQSVLSSKYEFITCTEVVEHVCNPQKIFKELFDLLEDQGVLAIMTQIRYDTIDFEEWWYPKDPTHICFFSNQTFAWIADHFKIKWESPVDNVIFFQK
jgi:hypothetical protein